MAYLDETGLKELWSKMKDKMYPVGSVYLSTNSTSPADIYGGTWEQLKGAFLYAGEEYGSGNGTGTSTNSHALTVNEMPSHIHNSGMDGTGTKYKHILGYVDDYESPDTTLKFGTTASLSGQGRTYAYLDQNKNSHFSGYNYPTVAIGGNAGHSHDIPYISVYAWRRTK